MSPLNANNLKSAASFSSDRIFRFYVFLGILRRKYKLHTSKHANQFVERSKPLAVNGRHMLPVAQAAFIWGKDLLLCKLN